MSSTIDIGHFARIPLHVAHANVPERAKGLWRELAFLSSPEKPNVWLRQQTLAEKLQCSVDVVGRSIKTLIKAGLLLATNQWHQGRYKVYQLVWSISCKTAEPPAAPMPDHVPQKSTPIIRVEKQTTEHFLPNKKSWQEKICLFRWEIWQTHFGAMHRAGLESYESE